MTLDSKIKIRFIDDNSIHQWTLKDIIHRINQDNATDEFNYDESDWVDGFYETLLEFYSLTDKNGKPLNKEIGMVAFSQFKTDFSTILKKRYGIEIDDCTDDDFLKACFDNKEEVEDAVEQIATKRDLNRIDSFY